MLPIRTVRAAPIQMAAIDGLSRIHVHCWIRQSAVGKKICGATIRDADDAVAFEIVADARYEIAGLSDNIKFWVGCENRIQHLRSGSRAVETVAPHQRFVCDRNG